MPPSGEVPYNTDWILCMIWLTETVCFISESNLYSVKNEVLLFAHFQFCVIMTTKKLKPSILFLNILVIWELLGNMEITHQYLVFQK